MRDRTNTALAILVAALALGLLGDLLLRARPWGLNIFLWMSALVTVVTIIQRQHADLFDRTRWFNLPIIFLAAVFLSRDSWTLNSLTIFALLFLFALVKRKRGVESIHLTNIAQFARGSALTVLNAAWGFARLLFEDIKWNEIPRENWSKEAIAVARGLLLATPILFIFTMLFVRADVVFSEIVGKTVNRIFDHLFVDVFIIAVWSWIAGGVMRDMLMGENDASSGEKAATLPSLGIVETSTIVGLLNALFLSFVIVQFRYFFGGAPVVEVTSGLTYAEYARHGFFELVTVSALVLPLLLMMHWLLRKDSPRHESLFRLLAGMQILMLFIIMASAIQHMRLYQNEYGMTELRLYTTVFMGWLAIVFIWFAATVLRGRRDRFAFGALAAGMLIFVGLLGINPDGFIVRLNAERAKTGRSFDARYATSLSADAIPDLITALPNLNDSNRVAIATHLLKTWPSLQHQDWRTWSWSRSEAKIQIQNKLAYLQGIVRQQEQQKLENVGGQGDDPAQR